MKEQLPILFSPEMVRAILAGRKTQTRRVIKPQPDSKCDGFENGLVNAAWQSGFVDVNCPYDAKRLWVREAWANVGTDESPVLAFRADAAPLLNDVKWSPSIHMRRSYSRIVLEVTDIRVQRLQEMSELDAQEEGFWGPMTGTDWFGIQQVGRTPRDCFRELWDKLNAARGFAWESNPWVWAISFQRTS